MPAAEAVLLVAVWFAKESMMFCKASFTDASFSPAHEQVQSNALGPWISAGHWQCSMCTSCKTCLYIASLCDVLQQIQS